MLSTNKERKTSINEKHQRQWLQIECATFNRKMNHKRTTRRPRRERPIGSLSWTRSFLKSGITSTADQRESPKTICWTRLRPLGRRSGGTEVKQSTFACRSMTRTGWKWPSVTSANIIGYAARSSRHPHLYGRVLLQESRREVWLCRDRSLSRPLRPWRRTDCRFRMRGKQQQSNGVTCLYLCAEMGSWK